MEEPLASPGGMGNRRFAFGVAALWLLFGIAWWLDVTGHLHAPLLGKIVVLAAVLATLGWLGRLWLHAFRAGGERRETAIAVAGVFALALAVRLLGISHEATGRYYADEGTYYHHASKINEGEVLRRSFVYPHLTYYLDAFALWAAGLFPGLTAQVGEKVFGLRDPLAVSWVLLRAVVALLGALTALPVFAIGRRLAGRLGGWAGAALLIFSPLYNAGSHLNTCDIPSAFFATLCLWASARLLDEENSRGYVLAGLAAGFAAVSKYPAGICALAIVVVWLRWRLVRRNFSWGLLWAGLAAIAAFVGAMPSLLAYPDIAFGGGHGMFFGVHQYGKGGWIGVIPQSNGLFYLQNLAESFGWPALVSGLAGLAFLGRERWARLLWLLPFPALYFSLICSMNMVVKRNLYPALPAFAAFLGAGLATLLLLAWERETWGKYRLALRGAAVLVAVACFALPVWATAQQAAGFLLATTREQSAEWIRRELPPGVRIVKEAYTPDFGPQEFAVFENRFVGRFALDELRGRENDYLLIASDAYRRFLNPEFLSKPHQRQIGLRYQTILDHWQPLQEWSPTDIRQGPILKLYRLEPLPEDCVARQELAAAGAFVPDPARKVGDRVAYSAPGQWAMLKGCFPAGRYSLALKSAGKLDGGQLRVVGLAGAEVGRFPLNAPFTLPQLGKYLFYVELPAGTSMTGAVIAPAAPAASAAPAPSAAG